MEKSPNKINVLLYPISLIYGVGVWLRNKFFDWGLLEEKSFNAPIISIGNITVGGTGKTPHTEYLIRLLQKRYKVAVLSRGYKRKSKGFVLASEDTDVSQIGDEPYQMKKKFPNVHVAVDSDRCHGIEMLFSNFTTADTEVILLDDAYQHRYVKPGINILLVDYNRMLCDDMLLPAGRMRERERNKSRANMVIITKCPEDITPFEINVVRKKMNLFNYQELYLSTLSFGKLYSLAQENGEYPLTKIKSDVHILVVTGIASAYKLIDDLKEYSDNIHHISFGDHHDFSNENIQFIRDQFEQLPDRKRMIITTEKDAAKLSSHPALDDYLKQYIYVLPIEVKFLSDQEKMFNYNINEYVRKNPRNSSLSS